jgi:hypothetical protein
MILDVAKAGIRYGWNYQAANHRSVMAILQEAGQESIFRAHSTRRVALPMRKGVAAGLGIG